MAHCSCSGYALGCIHVSCICIQYLLHGEGVLIFMQIHHVPSKHSFWLVSQMPRPRGWSPAIKKTFRILYVQNSTILITSIVSPRKRLYFNIRSSSYRAAVCKTVRPMLLYHCLSYKWRWCFVAKRMDQYATWYQGRPRPRPYYVRWGSSSPQRGTASPIFGPSLLWPNGFMDQDAIW